MDYGIADGFRAAAASGEIRMAGDFKCDFKCDFRKSGSDFSFLVVGTIVRDLGPSPIGH